MARATPRKRLAESYIVRTDRFMNRKSDGAFMEPQACLASFDLSGNLTLWTSTQVSHYVQRTVAMVLEMPLEKVRVIAPNGGRRIRRQSQRLPSRNHYLHAGNARRTAGETGAGPQRGVHGEPGPPPVLS